MNCPKCQAAMESVEFAGIEVDRCTGCGGLWFDMLEADKLARRKGSEVIDTGDRKIGRKQNRKRNIECPKCHTPLTKMVAPDQPHIEYESCGTCFGAYFDAGEFTDLKEHSLSDVVRRLVRKVRG